MPTTALRIGRVAFAATLALTLAGPLVPRLAAAQRRHPQPWERRSRTSVSIGGDAVYTSVGSRDGAGGIGDGVGFDAHASLDVSALSLGAGYQRTSHDLTGTTRSAVYDGFYVEPRVRLELGGTNFTPYVAGRVGRMRQTIPNATSTADSRRTGTALGAGGGLLVSLTRGASLDLGALWSTLSYSEDRSLPQVVDTGKDGVVLRAGLRLTP
jgi:hypothetical protein